MQKRTKQSTTKESYKRKGLSLNCFFAGGGVCDNRLLSAWCSQNKLWCFCLFVLVLVAWQQGTVRQCLHGDFCDPKNGGKKNYPKLLFFLAAVMFTKGALQMLQMPANIITVQELIVPCGWFMFLSLNLIELSLFIFFHSVKISRVWTNMQNTCKYVKNICLKLNRVTAAYCAIVFVSVLLNCQTHESLALICRLTVCQLSDSGARLAVNRGWRGNGLHVPHGFFFFSFLASCVSIFLPPPHVSPGANKTEDCG